MSCKKKEQTHQVVMRCYSICTPYTFGYTDKDGDHSETITTKNYSKSFEVIDGQLSKQMGVTKIGKAFPDSIYVRAEIDGKITEEDEFINCPCDAMVTIQLSQAK
jgi:hypothetical protein